MVSVPFWRSTGDYLYKTRIYWQIKRWPKSTATNYELNKVQSSFTCKQFSCARSELMYILHLPTVEELNKVLSLESIVLAYIGSNGCLYSLGCQIFCIAIMQFNFNFKWVSQLSVLFYLHKQLLPDNVISTFVVYHCCQSYFSS